jgi:hypothetical protein
MFDRAEATMRSNPRCKGKVILSRHSGFIHASIMLTGQISAMWQIHAGGVAK